MGRVGNYIVGASVVSVLAGNPAMASVGDDTKDDIKEEMKTDYVAAMDAIDDNEQQLKETSAYVMSHEDVKKTIKDDVWEGYQSISNLGKAPRIKNLAYQKEFFSSEEIYAYYNAGKNAIVDIVSFKELDYPDILGNSLDLAHETEHMHQAGKINLNADMSFEQHYKLHCFKEIGANVAQVLQLRAMYKEAQTEEKRQEILEAGAKKGFGYYVKAVQRGLVDPLSDSKEDFDKEMSFIMNETVHNWKRSCESSYDDVHIDMTLNDIKKGSGNLAPNDKNYEDARRFILSMGGVDFSQYLDRDFFCGNFTLRKADKKIAEGEHYLDAVKSIEKMENVGENKDKITFTELNGLNGFNLRQKYVLSVHAAFANKIKDTELADMMKDKKIDEEIKGKIEDICNKNDVFEETNDLLCKMETRHGVVWTASDKAFNEELRKIWTTQNSNGEDVCLLDGMEKMPDFDEYIQTPDFLTKLDERPLLKKAMRFMAEQVGIAKKVEDIREKMDIFAKKGENIGVRRTTPLRAPKLLARDGEFSRSEFLYTSDIIDTRSDYLLEERRARLLQFNDRVDERLESNANEEIKNEHEVYNNINTPEELPVPTFGKER
ncbi:MAG: hypothetical protein E7005_06770 [Alphaproteobacteria bacterium]|nr:hypothetical protein [Alphaproteobacteria bacterium]